MTEIFLLALVTGFGLTLGVLLGLVGFFAGVAVLSGARDALRKGRRKGGKGA